MKQIIQTALCVLLCAAVLPAQAVSAEAEYADAAALVEAWAENITQESKIYGYYPDYVCGVWTETGSPEHLTIGVVEGEAGELGKQEILAAIEDDNSVSFVTQKHSMRELSEINYLLQTESFGKIDGFNLIAVDERNNTVRIGVTDLEQPTPEIAAFLADCAARWGDAVTFEEGEAFFTADGQANVGGAIGMEIGASDGMTGNFDGIAAPASANKLHFVLVSCAAGALLLLLAGAWRMHRYRLRLAAAANTGTVLADCLPKTDIGMKFFLRAHAEQPPAALRQKNSA